MKKQDRFEMFLAVARTAESKGDILVALAALDDAKSATNDEDELLALRVWSHRLEGRIEVEAPK